MISYKCSKCGEKMQSPSSLAGHAEACPCCQTVNYVPAPRKRRRNPPVLTPAPNRQDGPSGLHWVDIKGTIIRETANAILFRDAASGFEMWFARSVTDCTPEGIRAPREWYERKLQELNASEPSDPLQREWLFDCLQENKRMVLDEVADDYRSRDMEIQQGGRAFIDLRLAGWIITIGRTCTGKHLDGLLVRVQDALLDPELLPPYDTCDRDTCECEFNPVSLGDVPPGTRFVERVPRAYER